MDRSQYPIMDYSIFGSLKYDVSDDLMILFILYMFFMFYQNGRRQLESKAKRMEFIAYGGSYKISKREKNGLLAAKHFDVPRSTLFRLYQKKKKNEFSP